MIMVLKMCNFFQVTASELIGTYRNERILLKERVYITHAHEIQHKSENQLPETPHYHDCQTSHN